MRKRKKKRQFNTGCDAHVINEKILTDGEQNPKNANLTRGCDTLSIKPLLWRGHHLLWKFNLIGERPQRGEFKTVHLRGWHKRIWRFKGCEIVANLRNIEVWVQTGTKKNARFLIADAWERARKTIMEFAQWQQILIAPIHSDKLGDQHAAHLVLEERKLYDPLKAHANRPEAEKVGMHTDGSHPGKIEFNGERSAEGAAGADYIFLKLPGKIQELEDRINEIGDQTRINAQATEKVAGALMRLLEPKEANKAIELKDEGAYI